MTPADPPTGGRRPDPLTALARSQERTDRRVDEVLRKLASLADSVATIGRAGGGGGGQEDDAGPLPSWLVVEDPDEAVERLTQLIGWLDAVYLRYEGAELPSCWLWHPGVVEELLVLRELWLEAFERPSRSWKAVGEWHERHRPGVVGRLKAVQACDLADHREGGDRDRPEPKAQLRSALPVLPSMWAVNREVPYPTEAELADARHHTS